MSLRSQAGLVLHLFLVAAVVAITSCKKETEAPPDDPRDKIMNGANKVGHGSYWVAWSFGPVSIAMYADGTCDIDRGAPTIDNYSWRKVDANRIEIDDNPQALYTEPFVTSIQDIQGDSASGVFMATTTGFGSLSGEHEYRLQQGQID